MKDKSVGRTRAEKSDYTPAGKQFRNVNVGMFSGPKPSYQRYTVSEQAADILNRSIRNMDTR